MTKVRLLFTNQETHDVTVETQVHLLSRAEWSHLLAEYEAGDTTQRDFCAERGLSYSNFCRWRLRKEERQDGNLCSTIQEAPLSSVLGIRVRPLTRAAPSDAG